MLEKENSDYRMTKRTVEYRGEESKAIPRQLVEREVNGSHFAGRRSRERKESEVK